MQIKKIRIRNFGQFHNREFTFAPGLNVIYGENESGKTTLHTFLVSMLFGLEKSRGRGAKQDVYTKYEPWNSASFYSGEMEFEVGGKDFGLERNFYHREKQTTLISRQDGELLSEEYGDLQMLLGGLNKEMYENTYCIPQAGAAPGKELAEFVQNCMANAAGTGDGTLQLNLALAQIHKKRKQAAAQVKQETELRQHRMEKLQIEREILEEDIAQLQGKDIKEAETAGDGSEKHQKRNGMPAHLLVLILGCFFMAACFLGAAVFHIPWNSILMESIVIGEGVQIGPDTKIYDHDHDYRVPGGIGAGKFVTAPVTIGDNSWIGCNVIILRGTSIGKNCIVGAGSVLKGAYPAGSVIVQKRQTTVTVYPTGTEK